MGMFSGLGEKLNHIFSKLTKRGKLTELEIKQAMREVRVALLEADVNFLVAKDFINKVSEKAIGEQIINSLTPGQQVIKIVNDELIALMGSTNAKLEVASNPPTVIMMCGLQGAGKTTMCGKLGFMLKKQGKKPLLVACDIYRPAAINQLKVVAKNAGVEFFEQVTHRLLIFPGVDRLYIRRPLIQKFRVTPPQPLVHIPAPDRRQTCRDRHALIAGVTVPRGFEDDRPTADGVIEPGDGLEIRRERLIDEHGRVGADPEAPVHDISEPVF